MTLQVSAPYGSKLGTFLVGRRGALLLVRTNGKILRLTARRRAS